MIRDVNIILIVVVAFGVFYAGYAWRDQACMTDDRIAAVMRGVE